MVVPSINPEPAITTQPTALETYLQRLPMILDNIEALRRLADHQFGYNPDAIHWGHVGDVSRVDQALDDLLRSLTAKQREVQP